MNRRQENLDDVHYDIDRIEGELAQLQVEIEKLRQTMENQDLLDHIMDSERFTIDLSAILPVGN